MAMQHFARVVDTRLCAHSNSTIKYVVEEGAQNVAYIPLASSSHSNQSTTFNLNNIAQFVARDSRLNISLTATATVVVANNTGVALNLINADNFGTRQFPYNRAVSSVQHKINQASYTLQTSSILDAIARLNMLSENANFYDNTQPDCIDNFANATGSNLTPLGSYTSTQQGNGIFKPRTLNYTVSGNNIAANSNGTVTITLEIYEPIISPFNNIGDQQSEALYAINGEILSMYYQTDLFSSMFNLVAPTGLVIGTGSNGNPAPTVNLGTSATLNCIYLTAYPEMFDQIPRQSLYHYNDYVQYQNDIATNVAPNAILTGKASAVCNWTNIPQKILIYARVSDGVKTYTMPDNYLTINSVQCVFDNGQPMLSAATPDQLFEISQNAGLTMERANWLGKVLNPSLVACGAPPISGCGSVLVVDPALVLGLRPGNTNGTPGRFVFQVQNIVLQNNTSMTFPNVTLYVVGITNALLERNGSEYRNYNLSVPYDVLMKAHELSPVSTAVYNQDKFQNLFLNGGGIGDWFKKGYNLAKSGVSKVLDLAQQHPELVKQGIQFAKQQYNKGKGGAMRMVKGLHDIHPKRDMDLYFE